MDKKAIAAYWTLARLMHKIDPEKADTPQAKLLCAEFAKLKNMYLAYIDKLNYATIEDVCHADDAELMATTECIDVMLNVV